MEIRDHFPKVRVVDSHTAGEPTRVVVEGAPDLGHGDMASRLARMCADADWLRTALVTEPRGSEWMVGAMVQPPLAHDAAAGVLFFNNAGYLGMCGHGVIGVVTVLAHLGKLTAGEHRLETPVGDVSVRLHDSGEVSLQNVRSYRLHKRVALQVPGVGELMGDVAWGGNWFFLAETDLPLQLDAVDRLSDVALRIRAALDSALITGDNGACIDHIEQMGPPSDRAVADARNFVLCPGKQYDRSPCGTGTSAKLACLAEDGALAEGQIWRQESIIGTVFEASYRRVHGGVIPTIRGRAFVNGDLELVFDPADPLRYGFVTTR